MSSRRAAAAILALAALALPALAQTPSPRIGDALVGTRWRAEILEGEPVARPAEATIDFLRGDHVRGQVGCNRFVGPFATRDDKIVFGPLRTTRATCPAAGTAQADRFLRVLRRGGRVGLAQDALTITPTSGVSSRFVPRTD
jgi:heat shock protein HslJ